MAAVGRPLLMAAGAAAVLALVSGCDGGTDTGAGSALRTSSEPSPAEARAGSSPSEDPRCRTAQLRASVGRNDPGAGQANFPVVLTNTSARDCTVRGYPGAAFLDAAGRQLGADPRREPGDPPVTVTLAPGDSAWAGLTFSRPEVSGARAATPTTLLVTPPDERQPLKVAWTGGEVPVSGTASTVRLTVLAPGAGP
jgi:hypothetical protein